jgi:hypothetical protein
MELLRFTSALHAWWNRVSASRCTGESEKVCRGGRFHDCESLLSEPMYADITWGAGGATSETTLGIAVAMQKEHGLEVGVRILL